MSYGPNAVFTFSIASGTTSSPALDLGRSWKFSYLEVKSMASLNSIFIRAASSFDSTYRQVKVAFYASTLPFYEYSAGAQNGYVQIPTGLRYVQVTVASAFTNGQSFTIVCGDYS